MNQKIKPAQLVPGDRIGVVAPASTGSSEQAIKAAQYLESLGFQVEFGQSLNRAYGYLAGTDQERADEIHQMFADKQIDGIFCVRGGYGSPRIADLLDYDLIAANPKVFWGYSDITFLHVAMYQKAGLITFHGPMLSSDIGAADVHPMTLQTLEQVMLPKRMEYTEAIAPLQVLVEGEAEGELIGGNLSLLVSTLGTPFEVDTKGKLFFIEEIEEEPYRVDRMLNQLRQAGKFDDATGIMICDFHDCGPKKRQVSLTLDQVFEDHIIPAGKPTLSGFKIGHCSPTLAVPIGVEARMSTYEKSLICLELGVREREE